MTLRYVAAKEIRKGQHITADLLQSCLWNEGAPCQPLGCGMEPACKFHVAEGKSVPEEDTIARKVSVEEQKILKEFSDKLDAQGCTPPQPKRFPALNDPPKNTPPSQLESPAQRSFQAAFAYMQKRAYNNAVNKGFWKEERELGTALCLIHAEVSEALEALRNGNPPDKHLPARSSFAVELADIVIRVMDLAGHENIDLGTIILEKMALNETRPVKHVKKYNIVGNKRTLSAL